MITAQILEFDIPANKTVSGIHNPSNCDLFQGMKVGIVLIDDVATIVTAWS